ncbi:MAG: type II secretion system protein GspM [Geminicoccales bacterium]
MMLRPGSLIAKMAAVAILVILLLASYQLIIQPLIGLYQTNRDKITRSYELLQRYQALADERPVLIERLASLDDDQEAFAGYLEGPSDALAAAQLQNLATDIIEATKGDIKSSQTLPVVVIEADPTVRRPGVKLRFETSIDGLAAALYDLETVEPHLFIDQMIVTSGRARRAHPETDEDTKLDVRLDLFGYVRLIADE